MIKEELLMNALSEMETIAKAGTGKLPKTTPEANGGLSKEGDKSALAVKSRGDEDEDLELEDDGEDGEEETDAAVKGGKGKKKTLAQWAKEEDAEEAHKAHKAMEDESDEEDEEEESEDEDETPVKKGKKPMKKSSIADLIKSDAQSGAVVDVSPFIENLVDQVSDAMQDLRKSVNRDRIDQRDFNRALSKAMNLTAQGVLSLQKRLDGIEDLPAGSRRSIVSKSEVVERFNESGADGFDFNRDQILDAMTELAKAHKIQPLDVTRYEVTGTMESNVHKAVEDQLRKSA